MMRVLEIILAAGMFALLLSPVLALVAGAVMVLTGVAFIPIFAPLTTALVACFFIWAAVRDARRKSREAKKRRM